VPKKKANKDLIEEAFVLYKTNENISLTVSSVEAQDEDNYAFWRSLSPRRRLALHLKMAKEIYKEELKKTIVYDKIYFTE
jgi:hypothetical protein